MMAEALSKAKASMVASLAQAKMRRRHGLFVAEGMKCVEDTLGVFHLRFLVITENLSNSDLLAGVEEKDIFFTSSETMRKLSSLSTPPDILAVYELPERGEVPDPEEGALSIMLDGVQDPGNLGTIIRAAHWFGVKRIYCSHDTVDLFNPKTIMATMGSVGHVEVYYCDLDELLSRAATASIPVYATLLDGANIYTQPLSADGLVIMGNEGRGISESVRNHVTKSLTIPPGNTLDHAESLNVGVATAVVLSQFKARGYRNP